jgi:hypothetical protein
LIEDDQAAGDRGVACGFCRSKPGQVR